MCLFTSHEELLQTQESHFTRREARLMIYGPPAGQQELQRAD